MKLYKIVMHRGYRNRVYLVKADNLLAAIGEATSNFPDMTLVSAGPSRMFIMEAKEEYEVARVEYKYK